MRFKLVIYIDKYKYGDRLPINYQYECSAVIYKILSKSDEQFSQWLHDNGYTADKKLFKLFTFSRLQIPQYQLQGDKLKILSDTMEWYISFVPEISTREFIQGIFKEQAFTIGNKQVKISCLVKSIEMLPPPSLQKSMTFETISPICLTLKRANGTDEYISPTHPMANELIKQNLLDKYQAANGHALAGEDIPFYFKVISEPKSSLVTIKADTPQESKVRGYNCRFQLTAPEELMRIAYDGGIGSKNSMGFGMVKEWKEKIRKNIRNELRYSTSDR